MIVAKIIGTVWMLAWFFIILRIVAKQFSQGLGAFAGVFSLAMTWLLVGLAPVAIVKFGWEFIT